MGIPVIANSGVGDIDKIFTENKIGLIINEFNTAEFSKKISSIDEVLAIPTEKLVETSVNLFSLQRGIESYNKVYHSLLE